MPFTLFDDWTQITPVVKDIVEGKTTVKDASAKGLEDYKMGANEK